MKDFEWFVNEALADGKILSPGYIRDMIRRLEIRLNGFEIFARSSFLSQARAAAARRDFAATAAEIGRYRAILADAENVIDTLRDAMLSAPTLKERERLRNMRLQWEAEAAGGAKYARYVRNIPSGVAEISKKEARG
ncbi:MAG: hypothetical protein LBS24_07345 [Clostridiales Family XIII bacterium]|nr:hypothetical protein [Clostridiales Family XIII bacterium]